MNQSWYLRGLLLLATLLLATLLPPAVPQAAAQTNERCFAETGYCVGGQLLAYYERTGGVAAHGLPISGQETLDVDGVPRTVQWFERTRLELHPENPAPFDVQLGRLGVEALTAQGVDWWLFPPTEAIPGCRYFPETRHNLCGTLHAAWRALGLNLDGRAGLSEEENLAYLGMPLSAAYETTEGSGITVQWFERGRLEFHDGVGALAVLIGNELRGAELTLVRTDTASLQTNRCPMGTAGMPVTCGTLYVPEDRSIAGGRMLALAVAIVRTGGAGKGEPVVYLSGGPGGPALVDAPRFAAAWSGWLGNRDFIAIDQRGMGFSQPFLGCPEIINYFRAIRGQNLSRPDRINGEGPALLACQERFQRENVNLAAYTSANSAADVDDLRRILGYEKVNLFGISYGTRLALTMARDFPQSVRSMVLDSVYPTQVHLYGGMPGAIDHSLRVLFNRNPGLEQQYFALLDRLKTGSVVVRGRTITDGDLVEASFRSLYRTAGIASLPNIIRAAHGGNYTALANLVERTTGGGGGGPGYSQMGYYAIQCMEEIPLSSLEEVWQAQQPFGYTYDMFTGIMEYSPWAYELCDRMGTPADPRENEPVYSDVPTLLLAGQNDPITPPYWAFETASTLSRGYAYQFSGVGHAVIAEGGCPASMIRQFLNNPAVPPASGCVR